MSYFKKLKSVKEKKWKKETNAHHLLLRASHQVLILNADVKICLLEVVLQAVLELRAKHAMVLTLEEHVLHQWIAIKRVYVHESLNQIFLKM
jgi:hypothetical protein